MPRRATTDRALHGDVAKTVRRSAANGPMRGFEFPRRLNRMVGMATREYNRAYYTSHRVALIQRNTAYYAAHPEHRERRLVANRRRARVFRYLLARQKRKPCSDCGIRYPPYVMEFDHVRGEKIADLSHMAHSRQAWGRVLAEIAKCNLVCSNCHAVRTWSRLHP